jgi:RHS repeat-associated protein
VRIGYDDRVHSHPVRVEDSFGLVSEATYDYRFGRKKLSISVNDNPILRRYDAFGRTERIYGPYQMAGRQPKDPAKPTIRFAYHPDAQVPWARTEHLDRFRDASDPIVTAQFVDGLGRGIQTKKDATVHTGSGPEDVMTVSGRVRFDAFGRRVAEYHPITEPLGQAGQLNRRYDDVQPTRKAYDVLDRVTRVTRPDDTTTERRYGFGNDRQGLKRFETVITDAKDRRKWVYRDVRRLITAVRERGDGEVLWTSYGYDPLKQITRVTDAKGNTTEIAYDRLGRRTTIDNPDTGRITKDFDRAGNLVRKVTAQLRVAGEAIRYDTNYNRRTAIHYPDSDYDVRYEYGGPNAPANRAGRIAEVHDQAGSEERSYGPLGNVVEEVRTVVPETRGAGSHPGRVYATEYVYDSFGRLQVLVYPDGEALRYSYDSGGQVNAAVGVADDGRRTVYLRRLEYDKFGKRVYSQTGNGVVTTFAYRSDNRRLQRRTTTPPGADPIQDLRYEYDRVGNITELANRVSVPRAGEFGGPVSQSFGYDRLDRLTQASGTWRQGPQQRAEYELDLAYDRVHNITAKTQREVRYRPSGQGVEQKATSYDWTYRYGSDRPHAPTRIGGRQFFYDASGNQVGWQRTDNATQRTLRWDGANRLQSLSDNGRTTRYAYDAEGQRVLKDGPGGRTAYLNRYYSVQNGAVATKHIFAGKTRIASVVNASGSQGVRTGRGQPEDSGLLSGLPGGGSNAGNDRAQQALRDPAFGHPGQGRANRSETAEQRSSNVEQNPNLSEEDGSTDSTSTSTHDGTTAAPAPNRNRPTRFRYYYHTDHLGSTNYVTDSSGALYEHLQYFPFGEQWVDQRRHQGPGSIDHLFTGKELDERTGLYYFGARYYDPRTSVWQSTDPAFVERLDSMQKQARKRAQGRKQGQGGEQKQGFMPNSKQLHSIGGRFRILCGLVPERGLGRVEVEAAQVEIDGVDQALAVPEAVGPRLDLLNPVVEVLGQAVAGPGHDGVEDAA